MNRIKENVFNIFVSKKGKFEHDDLKCMGFIFFGTYEIMQ